MNKKLIMGLVIIFIMVSSIFGFIFGLGGSRPSATRLKYDDYTFRIIGQQYVTKIDGQDYRFIFFPQDLEYISISDDVKQLLDKPALTVTYNPESEIADNLGEAQYYIELQLQQKFIERAVTGESDALPVKSCADASEQQPVIELRTGNTSRIVAEGNCVIVNSLDDYDLYQQTERIVYTALGVMS